MHRNYIPNLIMLGMAMSIVRSHVTIAGPMGDFEKALIKKINTKKIDGRVYKDLFKRDMPAHARLNKVTAKGKIIGTSIDYEIPGGGLPLNPKLGDAQTIENCDFEPVVSTVTLGTEVVSEANWEKESSISEEFENTLEVEVNYNPPDATGGVGGSVKDSFRYNETTTTSDKKGGSKSETQKYEQSKTVTTRPQALSKTQLVFSEELAKNVKYTANYLVRGAVEFEFKEVGRDAFGQGIDAAFRYDHERTYFFRANRYIRYNPLKDRMDGGYPKNIASTWRGLSFTNGIDAAFRGTGPKVYFFKDDKYVRYDMKKDRQDPGYPKPIRGNWPGMSFTNGVDAAIDYDFARGKVYFFKGDRYVRYDMKKDRQDPGYPKPIRGNWRGMTFSGGITAAVGYKNQNKFRDKAYFFNGPQYVRFNIGADRQDGGYPKSITPHWRGLPDLQLRKGTADLETYLQDVDRRLRVSGVFNGKFNSTNSSFRVASVALTKEYCEQRWKEMGLDVSTPRARGLSGPSAAGTKGKKPVIVKKLATQDLTREKILPPTATVK